MVGIFRISDFGVGRVIDRSVEYSFTFDGKIYRGFSGDTIGSALLANGVKLVGRSFKYHRPRGLVSADESEPNGLVTILHGDGSREPNCQLSTYLLSDGLVCESQNCYPSLSFDLLSVAGLFSIFMPVGFYYKTFMGPFKRSWMWFEPFIRRAAGLGRASHDLDNNVYDHYSEHADVVIIGGGASGLSAALSAGKSGARVLLLDKFVSVGGGLLNESVGSASDSWLENMELRLSSMDNVHIARGVTVFGWYDGNVLAGIESIGAEGSVRLWRIYGGSVILASGALQRPICFGNNDLPGIMLSDSLRRYINVYGVLCGRRVVIFANDDSGYDCAFDVARVGGDAVIVDVRSASEVGESLILRARDFGIDMYHGHCVVTAYGRRFVKGCRIASYDNDLARIGRSYKSLSCDILVTAGGWTPTLHLHSQTGAKPIYDSDLHAFLPLVRDGLGHFCVGACAGIYDVSDAIEGGFVAGRDAAKFCGFSGRAGDSLSFSGSSSSSRVSRPLFYVDALNGDDQGMVFLDMQNDVSVSDIYLSEREGYDSVEHMKRYTTLGMATDQGKLSNMGAFHILADIRKCGIGDLGTTTFRPPYVGVSIGAIAGREVGGHFRPLRRIPLHDWHLRRGAVMVNSVFWQRPWYYSIGDGDDVSAAYIREMRLVREGVGLSDISTLGKIAVMGPDSGKFLDRVYVNGFSSLGVGRCRYGVMLRDDGFVLDDGTVSRYGENDYFMTTTTVEADVVYRRLEFLLESEWTDLRVHVVSVSDEWCGLALAGLGSREVLSLLVGSDVSDDILPYMGCCSAVISWGDLDLSVRLHRISFSGELGYEIYVRSGYGEALADACMSAGESLGIGLYGLEALGALRIEKGFLTSSEIDGRHGLEDLGLVSMASSKKAFLGGVLRHRDDFVRSDRPRLVGLIAGNEEDYFRNGSLIYGERGEIVGHGLGHVSSVTWSPSLNRYIGLGFVSGEKALEGGWVRLSYPLRGELVSAQITSMDFLARSVPISTDEQGV